MNSDVQHVPADHPLNQLGESFRRRLVAAQRNRLEAEFADAAALCGRALDDLKVAVAPATTLRGEPPASFGDRLHKDLIAHFTD